MDGILNINKPPGKTSFSIVSMVKRLSGVKRVGHAGTLDPAATGVLLICLGQGTRISEFLMEDTKVYSAEIELGITTDTYDADGTITHRDDPSGIDREKFESALSSFLGLIYQVPPMYSAVKYKGKPLYKWARDGKTIERKSRPVTVHSIELIDWQPPVAAIEVVCGKGTYIRSLAYDLGLMLGCGAYLKSLVRTRCGIFDINDSLTIDQLEDAFHNDFWQHFVYPIDAVFSRWTAIVVSDNAREDIRNGRPVFLDDDINSALNIPGQPAPEGLTAENRCRVYALNGDFLAVLRYNPEKGEWQPDKVFL
ncbi:tRNA pseudouridine(55) synthase TruB [Chloroflexota bacterium]